MSAEAECDVGRKMREERKGEGGGKKADCQTLSHSFLIYPAVPLLLVRDRPSDRREWTQMRDVNTHTSYAPPQREQF